jgi:hypothetical protein
MVHIPEPVKEFRRYYRKNRVPRFYSGELHLLFTASVLLGGMGWHLAKLRNVTVWELLAVPAMLLFGNWVEYMVHRYPLHNVYPLLKGAYQIHSLEHHRFYIYDAMDFESFRDFMMVLFPPWAPVLVVAFTSAVGAYLVRPIFGANAGHLAAAAGTSCLFLYEVLHSLAHCADEGWAGKLPLVQGIRRHHRLHHDQALMSRYNFNITFPIFDWVLGTGIKAQPPAPRLVADGEQVALHGR